MPQPKRNQWVQWYPFADRKQTPMLGWVTMVGKNTISICCLIPGDGMLRSKTVDGVRHVDDPELAGNTGWRRNNGGWDWVEETPVPFRGPVIHPGAKPIKTPVPVGT